MAENWSNAELTDAILAYKEMQRKAENNEKIGKAAVYRQLAGRHYRSTKAFEYRMQNISYVLSLLGREWLEGLKPARNVGTNVIAEIEGILAEIEGRKVDYRAIERANEIEALKAPNLQKPKGNRNPARTEVKSSVYLRDSNVVAWVLINSNGICELCDRQAPFTTGEGLPFLEVHHVKHLSENGPDTVSNAVALCPNCHRELHYGVNGKAKKEFLYNKIDRLNKE